MRRDRRVAMGAAITLAVALSFALWLLIGLGVWFFLA